MARDPKLIIATGCKGVGKSYYTLRDLLTKYINKRRILIFDVNDEYGDYELEGQKINLKRLALTDIPRFSTHPTIEARRVVRLNPDGSLMDDKETEQALIYTMQNFRNGCLVVEDLNTVFGDALPQKVSGLFCNNRQRRADLYLHLQSCGRVLPKMLQNCNVLRIHRQLDLMSDSEQKLGGEYEMFQIAYTIVYNKYFNGDERNCIFVNRDTQKIMGDYTKAQILDSIDEYLSINQKAMRLYLNKKDGKGKAVYSYEQAIAMKKKELIAKYVG